MKISRVVSQVVQLPADEPLADGPAVPGATRDIVMIDIMRVGGVTRWLKIAAMAEAFNLPVVSHLVPEIHVHLVAAVPNGLTVEYMPWTFRLYKEVPAPDDGELVVPGKPGWGLEFDEKALRRYGVR